MMLISQIVIENFKIFKGKHTFDIKNSLVFFVGENNTGKSSIFEAVSYLKSGLPNTKKLEDIKNKLSTSTDHLTCTIRLTGNIKEIITDFSEAKYLPYVFEEAGKEILLIQRSSEERVIKQNGKDKRLDIKTVTIWNPSTNQFENPAGIDSVLGSLFETQFIWADTDPADVSDFGSTKICGRLLNGAIGNFFESEQWKHFSEVHKETFHGTGDSLCKRTQAVEGKIKSILSSQYGDIGVKFNFSLPEPSAFYKAGDIRVDDGVDTKLDEKGTGLQRAVALAMIQVYSQNITSHPTCADKNKPLFFFIDEPEICLHPKAQKQLIQALVSISQKQQIFISTHSPYLIKTFDSVHHDLFEFERDGQNIKTTSSTQMTLFPWSPSWGEINYYAYGLLTEDFHNELYGFIQQQSSNYREADIERYLVSKGITKTKQWKRVTAGVVQPQYDVTVMTYIRNIIHHPENTTNNKYSDIELKESIDKMINLLKQP